MPIWKLTPLDPSVRNWNASTCSAPVTIRAPDERTARSAASIAFAIATPRVPGQDMIIGPWRHSEFVAAKQLTDATWPEDGPIEILDPAEANDELRGVVWKD